MAGGNVALSAVAARQRSLLHREAAQTAAALHVAPRTAISLFEDSTNPAEFVYQTLTLTPFLLRFE